VYPRVLDELLPSACHVTQQYANNAVEADHGRLKSRLRPMRARVISAGHAFVQNLRRGHYGLAVDLHPNHRISVTFTEPRSSHLNNTHTAIDGACLSINATVPSVDGGRRVYVLRCVVTLACPSRCPLRLGGL
jgi:hypothetical protein